MAFTCTRRLIVLLLFPLLILSKAAASPYQRPSFPERFEVGSKKAYANGDAQLASGLWQLHNSLTGTSEADPKAGKASLRIRGGGSATMLFDVSEDVAAVTFNYGAFGKDRGAKLSIWYSRNGGVSWLPAGPTQDVVSPNLLPASVSLRIKGPVRFSIRNAGDHRANVDDFNIVAGHGQPIATSQSRHSRAGSRDDHLALGNSSNASTRPNERTNYLLVHPEFALSYNDERGTANWVSWHLSMAWRGTAPRCNCFFPDSALPSRFFKATTSEYIGSGFDRGHLCPSDDRSGSKEANARSFLMTNIAPQSPLLNREAWQDLEIYARSLCDKGNELYVIAGCYGIGGRNRDEKMETSIAGGRIRVPSHFWKIMVVLPTGENDLQRITSQTRVIAVIMENRAPADRGWRDFRTSVGTIEKLTGYRFFTNLPRDIAFALSNKVDAVP